MALFIDLKLLNKLHSLYTYKVFPIQRQNLVIKLGVAIGLLYQNCLNSNKLAGVIHSCLKKKVRS